mgnify:FL=1
MARIKLEWKASIKELNKKVRKVKKFTEPRQQKVMMNDIVRSLYSGIMASFNSETTATCDAKGNWREGTKWFRLADATKDWKTRMGYPQDIGIMTGTLYNQIPRGNRLSSGYFIAKIRGASIDMTVTQEYVRRFNEGRVGDSIWGKSRIGEQLARPFMPDNTSVRNAGLAAIRKRWNSYRKRGGIRI